MLPFAPRHQTRSSSSDGVQGQLAAQQQARALLSAGGFSDAAHVREVQAALHADNSLLAGMFDEVVKGSGITSQQPSDMQRTSSNTSSSSRHMHEGTPGIAQPQQQQCVKRARSNSDANSTTVRELPVSLEELFQGTVKIVPVAFQHKGRTEVRQLRVRVEPGLSEGARIILPG